MSKILFRQNYILIVMLSVTKCLNHVRELNKNLVCLKILTDIYISRGSGAKCSKTVFSDLIRLKWDRICNTDFPYFSGCDELFLEKETENATTFYRVFKNRVARLNSIRKIVRIVQLFKIST